MSPRAAAVTPWHGLTPKRRKLAIDCLEREAQLATKWARFHADTPSERDHFLAEAKVMKAAVKVLRAESKRSR